MKHLLLYVSYSLFITLYSAENTPPLQAISWVYDLKNITSIAFPTTDHLILGGENGFKRFTLSSCLIESIKDQNAVFTISADKNKGLALITNTNGICIYDARNDDIIWSKTDLIEKNIAAIFGPENSIIILNTSHQEMRIINYHDNNVHKTFSLSCVKPQWLKTAFISYHKRSTITNTIEVAYLNKDQQSSIAILSDPIKITSRSTEILCHYNQEIVSSPKNQLVAIVNWITGCQIWNPDTNEYYDLPSERPMIPMSIAFHPSGHLSILDVQEYSLKYYDIQKKKLLHLEKLPFDQIRLIPYIRRIDFSSDGKKIAILGDKNTLIVKSVPHHIYKSLIS